MPIPRILAGLSAISLLVFGVGCNRGPDLERARTALLEGAAVVELPAGRITLDHPIVIPKGARNLTLRGNAEGSTLVLASGFKGSAAIDATDVSGITISGFTIEGDRTDLKSSWYLPLKEAAFADYYRANGIVVHGSNDVTIRNMIFSRIRAFPVIINSTAKSLVDSVTIEDSGTLNRDGKNNTTGGILFEEGCSGFEVRNSKISRVTGNAIWTHSYARSPRQMDGEIRGNTISNVARDAIQIGHATRVRVENNKGVDIGFPIDYVDFPGYATPVALDTSGNVDHTVYANNVFNRVDGECIDLDGFHDGEVSGNTCINVPSVAATWMGLHFGIQFGNHDPDMTSSNVTITGNTIQGFGYGGVFLVGDHHRITGNRFVDLNLEHCGTHPAPAKCNALPDQPDALRSGIYLSDDAGRLADTRDNVIDQNVITGFGIGEHCIAAKSGVNLKANSIGKNTCGETPPAQ